MLEVTNKIIGYSYETLGFFFSTPIRCFHHARCYLNGSIEKNIQRHTINFFGKFLVDEESGSRLPQFYPPLISSYQIAFLCKQTQIEPIRDVIILLAAYYFLRHHAYPRVVNAMR